MIRSKLWLPGLCAVVLGVMAFSASVAQAEWLILNTKGEVKNASGLSASLVGTIENKDESLLMKVIGLQIKKLCETATFEGIKLEKEGTLTNGSRVVLGGCKIFIGGKEEKACVPHSPGAAGGTIKSNEVKGKITGKRVLIEPKTTGGTFMTVEFGEECVLPTVPIFGTLYVKDCKGDAAFSEHLVKHLWEEDTVNSKIYVISDTIEHLETVLEGSLEVFLAGAHEGLKWGGD